MTKKDYELLAKALRGAPSGVVERVANALAADNVRFNRERFIGACGTPAVVDCEIYTHLGDAIVHPVSDRARRFFNRSGFVPKRTLPPEHYPFSHNPCARGSGGAISGENFTFVEMGEIEGEN